MFDGVCACDDCEIKRRRLERYEFLYGSNGIFNPELNIGGGQVGEKKRQPKLALKATDHGYKLKEVKNSLGGTVEFKTYQVYTITGPQKSRSILDVLYSFKTVLTQIRKEVVEKAHADDKIQMIISSDNPDVDKPVSSKLDKVDELKLDRVLTLGLEFLQSSKVIQVGDGVKVEFITVSRHKPVQDNLQGSGRKLPPTSLKNNIFRRRSCVQIKNDDTMCMARSIVVCLAKIDEWTEYSYEYMRHADSVGQRTEAERLHREAGIDLKTVCGEEELKRFENRLQIPIKVIDGSNFLNFLYPGNNMYSSDKSIYLLKSIDLHNNSHYDSVINVKQFLMKKMFCHFCNTGYDYDYKHRCKDVSNWCFSCNRRECIKDSMYGSKRCQICDEVFRNAGCEQKHSDSDNFKCKSWRCLKCLKIFRRGMDPLTNKLETNSVMVQKHSICLKVCPVCKINVDEDHVCYMCPVPFKEHVSKVVYLDFETDFSTGQHVPIYCYIRWIHNSETGQHEIGISENVTDEVGTFLFSKMFENSTIIAHNMRGFDGSFLLNYLIRNNMKPTNIITDGTKINFLYLANLKIKLIDSLNLIPLKLSAFPKAFGLNEDYEKGYFPHYFTRPCNYAYVGEYPNSDQYITDSMSESERSEFQKWYALKRGRNEIFNFAEQLKLYCKQDVKILERGVEQYRHLIKSMTAIKPNRNAVIKSTNPEIPLSMKQGCILPTTNLPDDSDALYSTELYDESCDPIAYPTLAGLCHAIFKAKFLKTKTIAQLPVGGYTEHQYSDKSIEWIEYLMLSAQHEGNDLKIIHRRNSPNGSEITIAGYKVDGYCPDTKTVYQFDGCYWHGHEKCVQNMFYLHPVKGVTYNTLLENTMKRDRRIREAGYKIIHMWECEWLNKRKVLKDELDEISTLKRGLPLNPRDAFFGGRVESFKMIESGRIEYVDVTSLYPYVISRKMYPVGHPIILRRNLNTDVRMYFGFVKCIVLPPKKLQIPVLPVRSSDKKLLFPLCAKCIQERDGVFCKHADEERCLHGTWFSEELKLAVSKGYEVLEVQEVFHFEKQSDALFYEYTNFLYKIKLLATPRPTDIPEDDFKMLIKHHEGIDLEGETFQTNPGLRYVAKILLNAFWGRFALGVNKPGYAFVSSAAELYRIVDDSNVEIHNVRYVLPNMIGLVLKKAQNDLIDMCNQRNIFIAAFTTGWARIELYGYLDALTNNTTSQVLYCDTDSVIYKSNVPPFVKLPIGPYMGELTNELDRDEYIETFVTCGPKTYAYCTNKGNVCLKIKGFSLGNVAKEAFKITNLKQLVLAFVETYAGEEGIVHVLSTHEHNENQQIAKQHFTSLHEPHTTTGQPSAFFNETMGISVCNPYMISRSFNWSVFSRPMMKYFSFNYSKRMILEDFTTIPFGTVKGG